MTAGMEMLLLLAIQLSFAPARLLIKDHGHDMLSHSHDVTLGYRRTGGETRPGRVGSRTSRRTSGARSTRRRRLRNRWRSSSDPASAQSHSVSRSRSGLADLDWNEVRS